MRGLIGRHRVLSLLAGMIAGVVLLVVGANAYVLLRAGGGTADVGRVRHAQVAIVPGALVYRDGAMSGMLADRVAGAARLFRAGKVDRILVSGDHGRVGYDEPDTMRDALLRDGVPARAIFTDDAGFDTWATMRRARAVFGVRDAVVVTQGFHMGRALFLAKRAGLDVQGLVTDRASYGSKGTQADVREIAARVKGAEQGLLRPAAMGGPKLPIGGDGRASWGPTDPGTPAPATP